MKLNAILPKEVRIKMESRALDNEAKRLLPLLKSRRTNQSKPTK